MLKLAIFGCLCAALLVKGQDAPPPPQPPDGAPPQPIEHDRVARQAMLSPLPSAGMMSSNMQGGNTGNTGVPGLDNIPDPTGLIAKAQEIGKEFMNGRRRRRQAPTEPVKGQEGRGPPPPDGVPPQSNEHNRVARQAPPSQQNGMEPNTQGGNNGNFGMQGLGNLPDPTAVIAKIQEIGKQFLNGRRRRQAPTEAPLTV